MQMKTYLSEVRSLLSGSGERIQKPLGPLAVTRPAMFTTPNHKCQHIA